MHREIVLASASPRRAELLTQLGLKFVVDTAEVSEELAPGKDLGDSVMELATRKARAVQAHWRDRSVLIIAADTIVVKDDLVMGKPVSETDAISKISQLSGAVHEVLTGVCIIDTVSGQEFCDYACTEVEMKTLSPAEIEAYVRTGEGIDKAGAYGIQGQGAVLIKSIAGSYSNVVGLPLEKVYQLLLDSGFDFWNEVKLNE